MNNVFRKTKTFSRSGVRYLSAAQAATALRSFYFAVHPDLFGRFPDIRMNNENSLKLFNGYLDELYEARTTDRPLKPVKLKFYLRTNAPTVRQQDFKSVDVKLQHRDPYTTIRHVLESCQLPTDHLPARPVSEEITR